MLRFSQVPYGTCTGQPLLSVKTSQPINKLSAEDLAEDFDRKKEWVLRMNPTRLVRSNAAARNDAMDMGMEQEVLSPGVENAEEANFGSQMTGVPRHLPKRIGNGVEK